MVRPKLIILLIATAFQLAGCSKSGSDFDVICNSFLDLLGLDNYNQMSTEQRNVWLLEDAIRKLSSKSNALQRWNAVANATASQRYELFVYAAEESGYPGWSCEVMRMTAHEVGAG